MTNSVMLKEAIDKSGLKRSAIAKRANMTRTSLLSKQNNNSQFTDEEIVALCDILGLSNKQLLEIFFPERVKKISTNGVPNAD